MAEDRTLPGWPKKKLVKEVRKHLSSYGIRPVRLTIWRTTWTWAEAIARSYYHTHWPLASEIGTQYILLLLSDMKSNSALRMPFRATEVVPTEVAAMLSPSTSSIPAIESEPQVRKKRIVRLMSNSSPDSPLAEAEEKS